MMPINSPVIWFDFDNAPHVPVLLPIIKELRSKGYKTILTARDKAETKELLQLNNEKFILIDRAFPPNRLLKLFFTIIRAKKLISCLNKNINKKIDVAVSHGSRSALLASWIKNIPSVVLYDYEYVNSQFQNIFAAKVLMPDILKRENLRKAGVRTNKLSLYPGIKEQIYINSDFDKTDLLNILGIDCSKIIIIFRPPSTTAHYNNSKTEIIMNNIINKIEEKKDKVFLIVLARTMEQKDIITKLFRQMSIPFFVSEKPLNGIDLISNSDLVISGGGTMIREASVMGIPSYSFFQGPKGGVDDYLEKNERLIFINSKSDVEKINFAKKQKSINIMRGNRKKIISYICEQIDSLIH